jgi:2-polyprenyl-3-methyl-5-hydroxy-6-metoxy-1,4-benzoquinol methylase
MLISIGHQTGLYETMAALPPATSEQIANAAGLEERYVREWLGGMTVGRIVEYNPAAGTYHLPPEHAASLTPAAGLNNLASFTQYISLMSGVEEQVVESFRHGGGVPYEAYPRFQQLQGEESAALIDASLVDAVLPLVPGLVERLETGIDVLDIGYGQGHAINVMARAFPNSRFTGYDFSEEGVAAGRNEAAQLGLSNAHFAVQDAVAIDEPGRYDLIIAWDVVHDLAKPKRVLQVIAETLRPDGVFFMVEIAASSRLEENLDHPVGALLYAASVTHCMTVSLSQNGAGLGTLWGEQAARAMLEEIGFSVEVKQLEGDFMHNYFIARKR